MNDLYLFGVFLQPKIGLLKPHTRLMVYWRLMAWRKGSVHMRSSSIVYIITHTHPTATLRQFSIFGISAFRIFGRHKIIFNLSTKSNLKNRPRACLLLLLSCGSDFQSLSVQRSRKKTREVIEGLDHSLITS